MTQPVRLTRERALEAAVQLADDEGLDAVSMRNLAARLGVVPMALYRHVTNKDDLLGGMVDTLIDEFDTAPVFGGGWVGDWRERVRSRVLAARRVIVQHTWARPLIESRRERTRAVLGHMDAVAGMFIEGGLTADLTHYAMHALGHRIWGFNPEAFEDAEAIPLPAEPEAKRQAAEQAGAVYPNIYAIAVATVGADFSGPGCDEDFEFEFTLDLILDAVARLHEAGWSSTNRS